MIIPVTLVLAAGLFLLDLKTPSGAGEWGLYLIPLLLAFRARQWWYPLVFAGVCTALLAVGCIFSTPGAPTREWMAANRAVGAAVCWITAAVLAQRKRAEQSPQSGQDVSEREKSEAVITRTSEQLQTLSRRLLELQESERRNIARELHDEIGQALTALKINLQAVQRVSGAAAFAPRLLDSIAIVDRTLRQVRSLSLDLRPSMLDDLGLCAALRWYVDQQAQRAGLRAQFVAGELGGRLETTLETTCFRVAQEAMTNVVRHAKASSVRIILEPQGGMLHLAVCDDGIGFDLSRRQRKAQSGKSLGLLGMEERASLLDGRVEWRTAPQQGTEVHAWFPLAPAPANVETYLIAK